MLHSSVMLDRSYENVAAQRRGTARGAGTVHVSMFPCFLVQLRKTCATCQNVVQSTLSLPLLRK